MFKITLKLSKSPLLLSYFMQFNIFKCEVNQEWFASLVGDFAAPILLNYLSLIS